MKFRPTSFVWSLIGVIFMCGLLGCDIDLFGNDIYNFYGRYYLITLEDGCKMLSYNDSTTSVYPDIVGESVFAVGYDKSYIIVKQHPDNYRNITKYFIIPISNKFNWKTNNGMIGPLTLEEFNKQRKYLNIEKIEFKIYDKDLERQYK